MINKKLTVIHEFGTLSCEGHKVNASEEKELSKKSFDNLWDFILENKDNDSVDQIMSIHSKGGRRYIKTGRYVGTIQTKDGQLIEVLPKIYKNGNKEEDDVKLCRRVFLRMLRAFQNTQAKTFQNASLDTQSNFPILEVYISNYLDEVKNLLVTGIKKNYAQVSENQKFLKGKLLINQQISKNCVNKTKFAIRYSKYIENIPQNRIIVSTLNKLYRISISSKNISRCYSLLSYFSDIPESSNIEADLKVSMNNNRLFESYKNLMHWSSQFLINRGFTTFSGNHLNQSLMFSAEKLFESFIAYLFKKYAEDYSVNSQHSKYFLVDKHGDAARGKFRLRPDIVIESKDVNDFAQYNNIIIDTKWKNIDSSVPEKNYLIDIKDMYQLYAYGQKYEQGDNYFIDAIPKLVLVYPYTEKFTAKLPLFVYEEIKKKYGLKLIVYPFNLANEGIRGSGYKEQIKEIIELANNPDDNTYGAEKKNTEIIDFVSEPSQDYVIAPDNRYMLVGYYKNQKHLDWILSHNLYNVRVGERRGALKDVELQITPSKIVLFNGEGEKQNVHVFLVNQSETMIANKDKMISLNYPKNAYKDDDRYKLFSLGAEIKYNGKFDIKALRDKRILTDSKNRYRPFFVKY